MDIKTGISASQTRPVLKVKPAPQSKIEVQLFGTHTLCLVGKPKEHNWIWNPSHEYQECKRCREKRPTQPSPANLTAAAPPIPRIPVCIDLTVDSSEDSEEPDLPGQSFVLKPPFSKTCLRRAQNSAPLAQQTQQPNLRPQPPSCDTNKTSIT